MKYLKGSRGLSRGVARPRLRACERVRRRDDRWRVLRHAAHGPHQGGPLAATPQRRLGDEVSVDLHRYSMTLQEINVCILTTLSKKIMGVLRHCSMGKESQFEFFPSLYLQNGFVAHSPLFNQLGIRSEQSRRDLVWRSTTRRPTRTTYWRGCVTWRGTSRTSRTWRSWSRGEFSRRSRASRRSGGPTARGRSTSSSTPQTGATGKDIHAWVYEAE